jgi:hypothetical protein
MLVALQRAKGIRLSRTPLGISEFELRISDFLDFTAENAEGAE